MSNYCQIHCHQVKLLCSNYILNLLISSRHNWILKLVLLSKSQYANVLKWKSSDAVIVPAIHHYANTDIVHFRLGTQPLRASSVAVGFLFFLPFKASFIFLFFCILKTQLCLFQTPALGSSLTAVDSGLLSTLQPSQVSLSLFLSSPDGATVSGTGVILPYLSTGTPFLWGLCQTIENMFSPSICFSLTLN